jgi:hypothetical protein
MIKPFMVTAGMLLVMICAVGIHYLHTVTQTDVPRTLAAVTELTGLSSPALSTAFYEPRVLHRQKVENPAYPQMLPINRMDFVYEE